MREPQTCLLIVQVHFRLSCVNMRQFSKICKDDRKYTFVANSYTYTAPLEKDFEIDANRARAFTGHCLCGVETVKRFVNIRLHCNVSNLKKISKMSTLHPLEKFLRMPMATFDLSTSFNVWTSQTKLTTYEIED